MLIYYLIPNYLHSKAHATEQRKEAKEGNIRHITLNSINIYAMTSFILVPESSSR